MKNNALRPPGLWIKRARKYGEILAGDSENNNYYRGENPGSPMSALPTLRTWKLALCSMPAVVSKRGFLVGLSPAGAREL